MSRLPRARAFTLVELLALCLVVAALISSLLLLGNRSRKLAFLATSTANLRQFATAHHSYAADNAGAFATFSWRGGAVPPEPTDPDLRDLALSGDNLAAASAQATHIARALLPGRALLPYSAWLPHSTYSGLVLANHLGAASPLTFDISPADTLRRCLRDQPTQPRTCFNDDFPALYSLSSSYEFGAAFYSTDTPLQTVAPGPHHNTFQVQSATSLGPRQLADVRFPSDKSMMWDRFAAYHGDRVTFHLFSEARVPHLFVDGHVQVHATATANFGWNPAASEGGIFPSRVTYDPAIGEPPPPPGAPSLSMINAYRFTRQGLRGRDFNGTEATTP